MGDYSEIKARIMEITPQMATMWLERMGDINRPVSQANVDFLSQQIQTGAWEVNGEAIVRDEDERVIDGQHRLWAIIQAGKSVHALVVTGVKRKVFATFDSGKIRNAADALHIARVDNGNPNRLASALSWVEFWESGWSEGREGGVGGRKRRRTAAQAIALAKKYPSLAEYVSVPKDHGAGAAARMKLWRGNLIFARWATMQAKPNIARRFWDDVETGENLSKDDPAYQLRERLHGLSTAYGAKVDPKIVLVWAIKAWNAAARGEKMSLLRFTEAETFPDIVGFPCPVKVTRITAKPEKVAV